VETNKPEPIQIGVFPKNFLEYPEKVANENNIDKEGM